MRFAPAAVRRAPTAATFSPSMRTSALNVSAAVTTVPPVMSVFAIALPLCRGGDASANVSRLMVPAGSAGRLRYERERLHHRPRRPEGPQRERADRARPALPAHVARDPAGRSGAPDRGDPSSLARERAERVAGTGAGTRCEGERGGLRRHESQLERS